jgi:hypothetical protein
VTTAEENATAKQQWPPHAAMRFTDFFFIILFSINNLNNYRFLKKVSQIMNLCTTVPRHENSTDIF